MTSFFNKLRDYLSVYQTYLNGPLLKLLVEDILDAFLVVCLTTLQNTQKLRMPLVISLKFTEGPCRS